MIKLLLVLIFQESLRTEQVPVQWKEANVMMAQKLARRDQRSGGHRFKSHPRLTFQL